MRKAIITCFVLFAVSISAIAQFTLVPQIGLDQSKTNITLNDLTTFSPLGPQFSPMAKVRLEYTFKKNHGPFAGISTSRSAVAVNFSNPDQISSAFTAFRNDLRLQFEAGYQLKSKPIFLKKPSSGQKQPANSNSSATNKQSGFNKYSSRNNSNFRERKYEHGTYPSKGNCYQKKTVQANELKTGCSQQKNCHKEVSKNRNLTKNKQLPYMRLQPMAGIAFIPFIDNTFEEKMQGGQKVYTYNAGNWNTAFFTGIGVEFGKGKQQSFMISLQYLKGIGNLGDNTLQTETGSKTTTTMFSSKTSHWNITAGFPISLTSKKGHKKMAYSNRCIKPDWQINKKGCYPGKSNIRRL